MTGGDGPICASASASATCPASLTTNMSKAAPAPLAQGEGSAADHLRIVKERMLRPAKYLWSEHAERNAVYNAARLGVPLVGCTCYVNWFPCADCARAVIQCGMIRLVGLEPTDADETWDAAMAVAREMFDEAGIEVVLYRHEGIFARSPSQLAR